MNTESRVPESISHDLLLAALELKSLEGLVEDANTSVYRMHLRHSLLSLARRAHLAVAAREVTGAPESELANKSTVELLVMLDRQRARLKGGQFSRLRYWS